MEISRRFNELDQLLSEAHNKTNQLANIQAKLSIEKEDSAPQLKIAIDGLIDVLDKLKSAHINAERDIIEEMEKLTKREW